MKEKEIKLDKTSAFWVLGLRLEASQPRRPFLRIRTPRPTHRALTAEPLLLRNVLRLLHTLEDGRDGSGTDLPQRHWSEHKSLHVDLIHLDLDLNKLIK